MTPSIDAPQRDVGVPLDAGIRTLIRLLVVGLVVFPIALLLVAGILPQQTIADYYFVFQDAPIAILIIALLFAARWIAIPEHRLRSLLEFMTRLDAKSLIPATAAAVFGVSYLGSRGLFAGLPLSADEFLATFDAAIFQTGRFVAAVSPEWQPFLDPLQPMFRLPMRDTSYWVSAYMPVNAGWRAICTLLGDANLSSPLLAALCIPLLYAVARRIFPGNDRLPLIAVLLLATSTQFLVMAMTTYAMTAHLAVNLAWLWLVLRDRPWSHIATLPVTFAGIGLHQIVFHPAFALPFIIKMWLDGRRGLCIGYVLAFSAIATFWISYWVLVTPPGHREAGGASPGFYYLYIRVVEAVERAANSGAAWWLIENAFRFLTWQNPLTLLLLLVAIPHVRRWPRDVQALLAGIVLMVAITLVVMPFQGHGWGFRYLHGFLGSFALIAVLGWQTFANATAADHGRWLRVGAMATAFAIAILLPLRLFQAHMLIEPYARAYHAIAHTDADVVLVDWIDMAYGIDLVRNDPWLKNAPKVMSLPNLTTARLRELCERYRIAVFDRSSPGAAGIRYMKTEGVERRIAEHHREILRACSKPR